MSISLNHSFAQLHHRPVQPGEDAGASGGKVKSKQSFAGVMGPGPRNPFGLVLASAKF